MVHGAHPADVDAGYQLGQLGDVVHVLLGDHVVDGRPDAFRVKHAQGGDGLGEGPLSPGAFVDLGRSAVDTHGDGREGTGHFSCHLWLADEGGIGDDVRPHPVFGGPGGDIEKIPAYHWLSAGEDHDLGAHVGDLIDKVQGLGGAQLTGKRLLRRGVAIGAAEIAAIGDSVIHHFQRGLNLAQHWLLSWHVDEPAKDQPGKRALNLLPVSVRERLIVRQTAEYAEL